MGSRASGFVKTVSSQVVAAVPLSRGQSGLPVTDARGVLVPGELLPGDD